MKNRLIKIFILFLETVLLYVLLNFNIGCFFKNTFGFRCPGCGLTRALLCILNLDFFGAIKYNIIAIPLFVFVTIVNCLLVYDIIFTRNRSYSFLKRLSKHYVLIFISLFVTMIINNVNKI